MISKIVFWSIKIAGSGVVKAIASGSGHFLVVLDEKVGMELIF